MNTKFSIVSPLEAAKHHGFELQSTGGNCWAFMRTLKSGRYFLITNIEGIDTPESFDERVFLGFFENDGTEISITAFAGLQAALFACHQIVRGLT